MMAGCRVAGSDRLMGGAPGLVVEVASSWAEDTGRRDNVVGCGRIPGLRAIRGFRSSSAGVRSRRRLQPGLPDGGRKSGERDA